MFLRFWQGCHQSGNLHFYLRQAVPSTGSFSSLSLPPIARRSMIHHEDTYPQESNFFDISTWRALSNWNADLGMCHWLFWQITPMNSAEMIKKVFFPRKHRKGFIYINFDDRLDEANIKHSSSSCKIRASCSSLVTSAAVERGWSTVS